MYGISFIKYKLLVFYTDHVWVQTKLTGEGEYIVNSKIKYLYVYVYIQVYIQWNIFNSWEVLENITVLYRNVARYVETLTK